MPPRITTLEQLSIQAQNPVLISDISNPNDFTISTISVPSAYYSLNNFYLVNKGLRYPANVQATLPPPTKNDGDQATCSVVLSTTIESFVLSGGLLNSINDMYVITQNNNYAMLKILEVDNDGSPTKYSIYDQSGSFNNDPITITATILNNPEATPAEVSFIPDKFCIEYVKLENKGSGYKGYDTNNISIQYPITLTNTGDGNYFLGYYNCDTSSKLGYESHISISELINGNSLSINNRRKLFSTNIKHNPQTITHPADTVTTQTLTTYRFDIENNKWQPSYRAQEDSGDSSSSSCDSSRRTILSGLLIGGVPLHEYVRQNTGGYFYQSLSRYADDEGYVQFGHGYFSWKEEWDDIQIETENFMAYLFAKQFELDKLERDKDYLSHLIQSFSPPYPVPYDKFSVEDLVDRYRDARDKIAVIQNKIKKAKKVHRTKILKLKSRLTPPPSVFVDTTCFGASYRAIMSKSLEDIKLRYKNIRRTLIELYSSELYIGAYVDSMLWLERFHEEMAILFTELDVHRPPITDNPPAPPSCEDVAIDTNTTIQRRKVTRWLKFKKFLGKCLRYTPVVEIPVALYALYSINTNTAYGMSEKVERSTWSIVCAGNPIPVPGMGGDLDEDTAYWIWQSDNLYERMMNATRNYLDELARNMPGAEERYRILLEGFLEEFKIQGYIDAGYNFEDTIDDIISAIQGQIDIQAYRQSIISISILETMTSTDFLTTTSGGSVDSLFSQALSDTCQQQVNRLFDSNCEDSCDTGWQNQEAISCLNNANTTFRPVIITSGGSSPE